MRKKTAPESPDFAQNRPAVSVLMPCLNSDQYLRESITSILSQPECLELLVADGGSSDNSISILEEEAEKDPRIRLISRSDSGPADALNKALAHARGTLIGWLNADDIYATGALARAVSLFDAHPDMLMAYGDGEEFRSNGEYMHKYPTLPPSAGIKGFRSHCFICQPTVIFRRSMSILLGPFNPNLRTSFDFDYWLRVFSDFHDRIGYIPHLQARTRLHENTITNRQRLDVAMEATFLLFKEFGSSDCKRLNGYAREIEIGLASVPQGEEIGEHLRRVFSDARPWLSSRAVQQLEKKWLDRGMQASRQVPNTCEWKPSVPLSTPALSITPFLRRPFGVNLIGHAFEIFGIGEDIRMAAKSLESAKIPYSVVYHPASNGAACTDRSLEKLICHNSEGGPYAFNIVCMAAPIHGRWIRLNGCDALRERYTIGSWPWETEEWPDAWLSLFDVVDELWPSSSFTASALADPAARFGRPTKVMPMAAGIDNPDNYCNDNARNATRLEHRLPLDSIIFVYGFDFNSTAIRKNPMAALEAFQLAFPLPHLPSSFGRSIRNHAMSTRVELVIKTFEPIGFCPEWSWLQARIAEDSRIHLVAETLDRDSLLSLYGCCDAYLSLHRSEGFGRGLAEALQLGLDVIATDYGGNTDFCLGPLAHAVRYSVAPIPRGSYPCADGHTWAEPDLEHAAELCRSVAMRRLEASLNSNDALLDLSRDPLILAEYRKRFSPETIGKTYRDRLEFLWRNRVDLDKSLRWRSSESPRASY